jgi:HAD superfamily hydrolase (TIGR01549 family)
MDKRMNTARVLCFDIGGTLLDSGPSFADSVRKLAGRPLLREEWNRYVNLAVGPVEEDLSRLASHLGLSFDDVFRTYASHHAYPRRLFGDVLTTLAALAHHRCVALSNSPRWLVAPDLGGAEAYLTDVFYSHEIGYAKPDLQAFRHVERALGTRSENIVMVGDSITYDYKAALAAGWQAVLLDRDGRSDATDSVDRITGLEGLVTRLGDSTERPEGAAGQREVEIDGKLDRTASAVLFSVPATVLGSEYTARPVLVRSVAGSCRARVLRRRSGQVVLLLGPKQCRSLGIAASDCEARLRIEIIGEKLQLSPPPDLQLALLQAGLSWESIPERDRHLAVGLIREAKTPELRRGRIDRLVSALRGARA